MRSLGEEIPGYRLREIIKEVDTNQNGTIEFNEFLEVTCSRIVLFKLFGFSTFVHKMMDNSYSMLSRY